MPNVLIEGNVFKNNSSIQYILRILNGNDTYEDLAIQKNYVKIYNNVFENNDVHISVFHIENPVNLEFMNNN